VILSPKSLALCRCKSGPDETRYRLACKAVKHNGPVVNTERNVGEQLKRPALMWTEGTQLASKAT
jgi:hypothetical protein